MREKYEGDSTLGVAKKTGKTLGRASGFTAFCNPRVESPYISWLLMKESYNLLN
jgi:hypothetical protein